MIYKKEIHKLFLKLEADEQEQVYYSMLLREVELLYKEYGFSESVDYFWYVYLSRLVVIRAGYLNLDVNLDKARFYVEDYMIGLSGDFAGDMASGMTNPARDDARVNAGNLNSYLIDNIKNTKNRANIFNQPEVLKNDFLKIEKGQSLLDSIHIDSSFGRIGDFLVGRMSKSEEIGFVNLYIQLLEDNKSDFKWSLLSEWLESEQNDQIVTQKRARVILLGNGDAGKSTLLSKFLNPKKSLKERKPTPRIEIMSHTIEGVDTDFWDFGGQVIMYATHNFFLNSEAQYLIVCNARANEEPDSWLEKLHHQLDIGSSKKLKVLVVYTFVEEREQRGERFENFRKNSLTRIYGEWFDLEFFAVCNGQNDIHMEVLHKKLRDMIVEAGERRTITYLHERYKQASQAIITYKELENDAKKEGKKVETFVALLHTLGYIFPLYPVSEMSLDKQTFFIWQKHWLTYGVYQLINSKETKEKNGLIPKDYFKNILFDGKKRYITPKGTIQKSDKKGVYELIEYDAEGIEILYQVVQNYGWAIPNNERFEELVFPHAVVRDEPESCIMYKYGFSSESSHFVILFDSLPDNFFFRFVTLMEKHISNPSLLWRTGVVLFDYLDSKIYAKIEMKSNKILISVEGERRSYLVQTIMYHITMLFERLNSSLISPKFFQKFVVEGKPVMVDMQVMNEIDSERYKKVLEEQIRKEQKMATINIANLNIKGDAVIGDNGTINKNTILNISTAFVHLSNELKKAGESDIAEEIEVLVAEENKDQFWLEKAKNLYGKVIDRAKDISVVSKAGEAIGKVSESESLKTLQEFFSNISFN